MKSFILPLLGAIAGAHAAKNCSVGNVTELLPADSKVFYAKSYPAHYNLTPALSVNYGLTSDPMGISAYELPVAACIAQANITLPNNTQHSVGFILPDEWNGGFLANGNGEFAGSITWDSIISVSWYGFAVVSSDLGHEGNNGSFGYHNEQALQNWGHVALHDAVVKRQGCHGRLLRAQHILLVLSGLFCWRQAGSQGT